MKAGTATKLVLNAISTGAMIRIGKTFGNLMIDLRAMSAKLVDRGERIVMEVTGVERPAARALIESAGGSVRTAIVMQQRGFSRAQAEQVQHAVQLAQSQLDSAQQQAGSVLAMLGGNPDLPLEAHPLVLQAQAALDRANLDLSYTAIRAPDDGVVARVEQLQVGDYIKAATPVFGLVSSRDVWVEANFKEDDLTYMRAGQSAEVSIDSYPGRRFKARVASLSPGTGAQFSLLPPENATGNWVKVVQRVPVRLQLDAGEFDDSTPLHAGLSAEVTVDTEHHRSLFGHARKQLAQR